MRKGEKRPQETEKKAIVDRLMGMNDEMREFSADLESRLDRAYKAGAGQKFGYQSVSKLSGMSEERSDSTKIGKIAKQAQGFLDKNGLGLANKGKKAVKALPLPPSNK